MIILGVDFGTMRTGVAVSDALEMMAHGICTIYNNNPNLVAQEILKHIKKTSAEKIVLGFPKNMDNTVGERGKATLEFAEILRNLTEKEVIMWDERLTTVSASRVLNETNTRGKKRKSVIDTVSAEIILQNYLDSIKKKGV